MVSDSNNNKKLEKEIIQEREISFQAIEKVSEIETIPQIGKFKKKYLGKEGIIVNFFQFVVKEKDLTKKKTSRNTT